MTTGLEAQVRNTHLPAWARVWMWCLTNRNEHGHARAYPGELRLALDLGNAREVSRAIRLAREHHVIAECSTAQCLVLPGHTYRPCDARHRGD